MKRWSYKHPAQTMHQLIFLIQSFLPLSSHVLCLGACHKRWWFIGNKASTLPHSWTQCLKLKGLSTYRYSQGQHEDPSHLRTNDLGLAVYGRCCRTSVGCCCGMEGTSDQRHICGVYLGSGLTDVRAIRGNWGNSVGYTQIAEVRKVGKIMKRGGKPGEEIFSSFLSCWVSGDCRILKGCPGSWEIKTPDREPPGESKSKQKPLLMKSEICQVLNFTKPTQRTVLRLSNKCTVNVKTRQKRKKTLWSFAQKMCHFARRLV